MNSGQHDRTDGRAWARRALALAFLWWALDEGRADGWLFAAVPIGAALAVSAWLPRPPARWRWSLRGWAVFVPYFLVQSVLGGWDVARRALHPRCPVDPRLVEYPSRLSTPTARLFLAHAISLLPGTLSADLEGATLRVHALSDSEGAVRRSVAELEKRIAGLFAERAEVGA